MHTGSEPQGNAAPAGGMQGWASGPPPPGAPTGPYPPTGPTASIPPAPAGPTASYPSSGPFGSSDGAGPSPWAATPASGSWDPSGNAAWPPGGGGGAWPPAGPPPPPSSSNAGLVIGLSLAAVIALVLGAVVFIGTTVEPADDHRAEERSRLAEIDADDDDEDEATTAPEVTDSARAEALVAAVTADLAADWAIRADGPLPVRDGACTTTSSNDRHFGSYALDNGVGSGNADVVVTALEDVAEAGDELALVQGPSAGSCLSERLEDQWGGTPEHIAGIAPDARTPGAGFRLDGGASYAFTIVIGTARADVTFGLCGCAGFTEDDYRATVVTVAGALARAQGTALN